MTDLAPDAVEALLERGSITFFYRPRVEEQHAGKLRDVQRILLLLSAEGAAYQRVIAIGRKRIPPSGGRDRYWGFVDLVLSPYDMQMALGAQVYNTRTRGLRHLPAAQRFAQGTYSLAFHRDHAHFRWHVDEVDDADPIAQELALERDADTIVTVANPDPAAWGLEEPPDLQEQLFDELEVHVTLPAPFPPRLQRAFHGRRFAPLDTSAWLDHPGAELVFVGAKRD